MDGEAKPEEAQKPKTSIGLEENVVGLLCYLLTWVTGLIFLLLEKENRFVRFHAMQSLVTFLSLMVVVWILSAIAMFVWVFWPLVWIVDLVILVFWIVGMVKAYQGEMYKFPVFGSIAESLLK
ncbi:MAG: DUF4870 domain-containing protein [Archaeoglobales archaeon]|nr:DUF4870 domain-containing protein [Archaeoglobales archaeon]